MRRRQFPDRPQRGLRGVELPAGQFRVSEIDAGGHVDKASGLVRLVQPDRFRSSSSGGIGVADEQLRARRAHCLPGGSPAEFPADPVVEFLGTGVTDTLPFAVGGDKGLPCVFPGAEMSPCPCRDGIQPRPRRALGCQVEASSYGLHGLAGPAVPVSDKSLEPRCPGLKTAVTGRLAVHERGMGLLGRSRPDRQVE